MGFSVGDIQPPTTIWCGTVDAPDILKTADYFAATIPHATRVTYPGEGHLFPFNHWAEMLEALRQMAASTG